MKKGWLGIPHREATDLSNKCEVLGDKTQKASVVLKKRKKVIIAIAW